MVLHHRLRGRELVGQIGVLSSREELGAYELQCLLMLLDLAFQVGAVEGCAGCACPADAAFCAKARDVIASEEAITQTRLRIETMISGGMSCERIVNEAIGRPRSILRGGRHGIVVHRTPE